MSSETTYCATYRENLESYKRSLEFEYKIGTGGRYNDLIIQMHTIEKLKLQIQNMSFLIEKHCSNND